MLNRRRVAAMRREVPAADCIPYSAHVAPHVVRTAFGDYLQVFRLQGVNFETADYEQLNSWHERLNVLWRNIASGSVALWSHVIRRRTRMALPRSEGSACSGTGDPFSGPLHAKYQSRLAHEVLMGNEIYLAVVFRPTAGMAGGVAASLLTRAHRDESRRLLADSLDACAKLGQTIAASLQRYEPELLGIYAWRDTWCSSILEYLGLLINGEWQRMPLPRGPLRQALATNRVLFGHEIIEYRSAVGTRVGAMLGIKEYPTPSVAGMYGALLSAPFEFVLTHSFTFLTKGAAQSLLQRQFNRMANAGDFAISQASELREALDALTSNEFVMGDHHFSVQVVSKISKGPADGTKDELGLFNDHVASARSVLADTGMLVAREDLAMEAAYWAQLPGNFPLRPRKAPITSRNFAAMSPFHNYPAGRATGNHWGDALCMLVTSAGSPYYFSLHAGDPADSDAGGGRKDTGHTLVCGPTGSGKTVLIGFLIAMLHRRGTAQVIFDKNHGLEILIRALGGEYLPLRSGTPTGFNPLQLPNTPANVEFLKAWLQLLSAGPSQARCLSVREVSDLEQALHGTLALDRASRRLSRLVEFLDPTDPEGLHARLAPWCEACQGGAASVFDNCEDTIVPRMASRPLIGIDVTDFIDNPTIRAPITSYLFHVVRRLLDGRRFVCWMDEFWRLLADRSFEAFAKDGPKTWRKLNAAMCLATQSAGDVLESSISRTLIEQTPTKIFFPNPDADHREFTEGLGLTEREFKLIKEQLEPASRSFLVKQGHLSVVCKLDLKDFAAELAVISGRVQEVDRMYRIISGAGSDPAAWLPQFMSGAAGAAA